MCRPIAQEWEDEPNYYHMRYRVTPDGVVVSSNGWGTGWTALENGEVLVVHRGTLDVSVCSVADAPAVR